MRNLRFPKEYVIVALTKKESTREGSRMKAQDQKELMRERICDCAKRLFEREGYEQVSMRQIAAEAGIAVGNLTYYFSKKEDLLKERLNDIQETFSESIQLFEIDLERGEISGKPFWEYENRTLLELLLRFLKAVEQFQKNAAIVYENYSRLQKSQQLYKIDQIFILVPLQFFSENSSFPQLLYKTIVYRHDLLRPFSAHFLKYGYCFLKSDLSYKAADFFRAGNAWRSGV